MFVNLPFEDAISILLFFIQNFIHIWSKKNLSNFSFKLQRMFN